jgi:hypothetical protein
MKGALTDLASNFAPGSHRRARTHPPVDDNELRNSRARSMAALRLSTPSFSRMFCRGFLTVDSAARVDGVKS